MRYYQNWKRSLYILNMAAISCCFFVSFFRNGLIQKYCCQDEKLLSHSWLFLALVLVNCELPEEIKKFLEECEQDIGELPKGEISLDDPKMKCFAACMFKKEGSLVDGKINAAKAFEFVAKHFPRKATDSAKADLTECATKANEGKDECEVSGAFNKCMSEKQSPKQQ